MAGGRRAVTVPCSGPTRPTVPVLWTPPPAVLTPPEGASAEAGVRGAPLEHPVLHVSPVLTTAARDPTGCPYFTGEETRSRATHPADGGAGPGPESAGQACPLAVPMPRAVPGPTGGAGIQTGADVGVQAVAASPGQRHELRPEW